MPNAVKMLDQAKHSNNTFQAVLDIANQAIKTRTIVENPNEMTHADLVSLVVEYDALLYDTEQINSGLIGMLCENDLVLSQVIENQQKETV